MDKFLAYELLKLSKLAKIASFDNLSLCLCLMINYTNRREYVNKLLSYKDKNLIKVVSGLRRSGKSTLLEIYRTQLIKQGVGKTQIQFYNFELPENYLNKTWDVIYFEIKKKLIVNKPNYIFLDEVQNIPLFEKLVDGLFASYNTDV